MTSGSSGYNDGRIRIDPSVVRGLEYYTGPVYEAELTFDVTNEKGEKVVFGSVGGGGRYDGLVSRFMGQPVPATGFSIGVSRLMTALKNHLTRTEMSQAQAAKLFGVTQPRVSDLMRGKINLFGLDALVNMASAAGFHIEMRVLEVA